MRHFDSMTVEALTGASLQEGTPQVIDKDTYATYQTRGGILSEERYDQASTIRNGILPVIDSSLKPAIHQAQSMASVAGIILLQEEISIYSFFRNQGFSGSESPNNTPQGKIDVWGLGDKQLLAEVLKMTGRIKELEIFIAAFPHIFNP